MTLYMASLIEKISNNKTVTVLLIIIAVSIFFRVYNMTSFDIGGDHALVSFRSLGWLDFIQGEGQTGPLQWLGTEPSWAKWSFQDAPPLVFLIQYIFFAIFGDNTFAARVPFVLAGILSVLAIYFLLKKYTDKTVALVGAGFMAVSSYAVWASLAGYLEGIMVLFVILSFYFVFPWISENGEEGKSNRKKYLWPVFTALALLSKYTSMFLLPAAGFSLLLAKKKKILSMKTQKLFFFSTIVFLVLLSPVIFYNVKMYQERGHPDSSLSSLLGIYSDDFYIIADRSASLDILGNLKSIINILLHANSLPLLILFIVALIWLCAKVLRRKSTLFENVFLIHIFFLFLMFSFSGGNAVRFLSITAPFIAIAAALFSVSVYRFLAKNRAWATVFLALIILVFSAETAYSLNTNIFSKPIGGENKNSFLYASARLYDRGWNDVARLIEEQIFTEKRPVPEIKRADDIAALSEENIKNQNVLLLDERLNWFALSWYMNKYLVYYKFPLFKVSALGEKIDSTDFLSFISRSEIKDIYFLYGVVPSVLDPIKQHGTIAESTVAYAKLLDQSGTPTEGIKDAEGNETFRIYKIR